MDGRAWALVLAITGLSISLTARFRMRDDGSRKRTPIIAMIGVPSAIIVGTLPVVLGLGEAIITAASIISMLITIATIVLLARHAIRTTKS